jgi:tRNA C32,U32 (ribose-2'-O)-methylase TrmJ
VHIPTDVHASLNVGQAVLLVASSVFAEATRRGFIPRAEGTGRRGGPARGAAPGATGARDVVPAGVLDPLIADWLQTVGMAGFMKSHEPQLVEGTLRRLLGRAELDFQEVTVLRGMLRKLRWRMEHGEPG